MLTRMPANKIPSSIQDPPRMARLWSNAWRGDPLLMAFACLLIASIVPMTLGLAIDERSLRGVNVWLKPIKFALSLGLLAWTTAFFAEHVDARRRGVTRALAFVRWPLIGAASFELLYITLQAARGEASHFNTGDPLYAALYKLMGLGALMLTATQALLAWLVARHSRPGLHSAYRLSVVLGLSLSFVLGTVAGAALSAMQPPDASSLPLLGWHLRGDLRLAHFVGLHVEQILPAWGALLVAWRAPHARATVAGAALAWTLLFVVLFALALGLGGVRY